MLGRRWREPGRSERDRASKMRAAGIGMAMIVLGSILVWSPVSAGDHKLSRNHLEKPQRECMPYNAQYGYYANLWCDTGSYRLEDIWFRERQRLRNPRVRSLP
jgi:hypothetical protein